MADSSWHVTTLGQEVDILTGFPFQSSRYTADTTGIPLLRGDNVIQGRLRWDDAKRWPQKEVDGLSDYFLQAGDIVLAMDRPWIEAGRKYAAVSEHDLPCLLVQRVARLRAKSSLDQRFLRYVIGSTPFTDHILGIQTGTAVPHISANQIRAYRFLKPPLDEQRAIGRILGALDDKIELNHRMNETLEATARTLFQSWFVEFDPVRAKAESRQPVGMDVEVAALFPYAFEDSALGPIPQGWTICPLSDTIAFTGGGTPKTSSPEYWGGEIPWFSVADAPRDSDVFVIDTEKRITQAGLENSSARMLRVGTTIISARGTVGRCAIVGIPMAMNQSCYGVNAGADRGDYFTYFSLRQDVADLKRSSHGSVFDTITRDTFERIDVACPPAELTVRYDDEVRNLMERILVNLKESRTLAATRDALLPRLLSGEVRAA